MATRGSLASGLVIIVLGIVLVALVWRGDSGNDQAGAVTIVPSDAAVPRWHQHTISAFRPEPAHTMAFTDGEFRVHSTAANTDGNQRELWTLDGNHRDVDVTVRIDGPSSLGGAFTPQPGLALRYHDDGNGAGRALIIDGNIWSRNYDRMIVGSWNWPAKTETTVRIEAIGEPLLLQERKAGIIGVSRHAGDPTTDEFTVDRSVDLGGQHGFAVGDRVDISTAIDDSYAQTGAEITAINPKDGLISVEHPGVTTASGFAPDVGAVKFHYTDAGVDPRAFYPRYVRARLVGSTIQVKSWLIEEPEPGWQFSETAPRRLDIPSTGQVGLVANHLHGAGRFIAFGKVTITPVLTP
ncbi:MAG TPA: hypothetical protein VFN21_13360 [Acidimicrobiales bacterium]|nr:hypothetical protein [Acidimicrobiales bacterium]